MRADPLLGQVGDQVLHCMYSRRSMFTASCYMACVLVYFKARPYKLCNRNYFNRSKHSMLICLYYTPCMRRK
jgi:hypothetical protein